MPRNKRRRGSEGVPYLKVRTEKWFAEAKWILQQETDKKAGEYNYYIKTF